MSLEGLNLYKVLKRANDGRLVSPFQNVEYRLGRRYVCSDFDPDPDADCSRGYYATGIDGIIYSFRNLPGYSVWEVIAGGRRVEINQFKRRYEWLELVREVPLEEVRALALAEEPKVGYRLAEALFPLNPLLVERGPVTAIEVDRLREWASVRDLVLDSVEASVGASVWAYTSSLFPGIRKWKYVNHPEGVNPFQPGIDLWRAGLLPLFDGKCWRLHAGSKAGVVWGPKELGVNGNAR